MIHHDCKISQIEFMCTEDFSTAVRTRSFLFLEHGFALRGCIAFAFFLPSLECVSVCLCVLLKVEAFCDFVLLLSHHSHAYLLRMSCFVLFSLLTCQFTRMAMEGIKVGMDTGDKLALYICN